MKENIPIPTKTNANMASDSRYFEIYLVRDSYAPSLGG